MAKATIPPRRVPRDRISGLAFAKLPARKAGAKVTISTSAASGPGADGDLWCRIA